MMQKFLAVYTVVLFVLCLHYEVVSASAVVMVDESGRYISGAQEGEIALELVSAKPVPSTPELDRSVDSLTLIIVADFMLNKLKLFTVATGTIIAIVGAVMLRRI